MKVELQEVFGLCVRQVGPPPQDPQSESASRLGRQGDDQITGGSYAWSNKEEVSIDKVPESFIYKSTLDRADRVSIYCPNE